MADHRMTKYSGFTLIELMAAITIIGILASMAVGLDFSRMNDREKRDRLVNAIVSTVRSEDTRRTTGKGIGTDLTHPSQTQIALSSSGVEVTYLSGSTITGTGILLQTPLYGESGYKINTPQLLHIDGTLKTPLSTGEIVYIELWYNGETRIRTSLGGTGAIVELEAGYNTLLSRVRFDSRGSTIVVSNP